MLANMGKKKGEPAVSPQRFIYDYDSRQSGKGGSAETRDPERMKLIFRGLAAQAGGTVTTFPRGTLMTRARERQEREGRK